MSSVTSRMRIALSHKGQFAWDFPMPLGTRSARLAQAERRETLPVRFRTADGDGVVLAPGKSYRAD